MNVTKHDKDSALEEALFVQDILDFIDEDIEKTNSKYGIKRQQV